MLLSGLILGLLAIGIIAHPIDHDHSSFVRAKTPDGTTTAEIVARENVSVRPRGATSMQTGTQSCHCTDHGVYNSYNVLIRIPYQGSGCDNTYGILDGLADVTNWQCIESDGNTQLYFNMQTDDSVNLNKGLLTAFPNIAGGFNCPAG
jgi:hypothetical protein